VLFGWDFGVILTNCQKGACTGPKNTAITALKATDPSAVKPNPEGVGVGTFNFQTRMMYEKKFGVAAALKKGGSRTKGESRRSNSGKKRATRDG